MSRKQTLSSRVHTIEDDMVAVKGELGAQSLTLADIKGEQVAAKVRSDAVNDKLDLLIEMQSKRMDRRNKIITTLIGAIGTAIGAAIGVACA